MTIRDDRPFLVGIIEGMTLAAAFLSVTAFILRDAEVRAITERAEAMKAEAVKVKAPPYVRKLNGVWPPWPCTPCVTVQDCDDLWKRMSDQYTRIARNQKAAIIGRPGEYRYGWTGPEITRFFDGQHRGYLDCVALAELNAAEDAALDEVEDVEP